MDIRLPFSLKVFFFFFIVYNLAKICAAQVDYSEFFGEDCGQVNESVFGADELAPWTAFVGIYNTGEGTTTYSTKLLLSGVIISPTKILTLWGPEFASLLYGHNGAFKLPDPKRFYGAAGFRSKDVVNIYEDFLSAQNLQYLLVDYVVPYTNDRNESSGGFYPIVIHLYHPLRFDGPYVQPLCMPIINPELLDLPRNIEKVAISGFEYFYDPKDNDNRLMKPTLLVSPGQESCDRIGRISKAVTNNDHTFCALKDPFSEDGNYFCGSHSSVITIKSKGRHYFGGFTVVDKKALKANGHACTHTRLSYFHAVDVRNALLQKWMLQNSVCSPSTFVCPNGECIPITQVCNHVDECSEFSQSAADEDFFLCSASNTCEHPTGFSCGLGHSCIRENQLCDGKTDCDNGADEQPLVCLDVIRNKYKPSYPRLIFKDRKFVPSRKVESKEINRKGSNPSAKCYSIQISNEVSQTCRLNGAQVSCDSAKPGTKMLLQCLPYYVSRSRSETTEMTCTEEGVWSPFKPFTCEADCGRLEGGRNFQPLIANGADTTLKKRFPWYAAIFIRNKKTRRYDFVCGGSLIEHSVILTSGNCVTDANGVIRNVDSFRIILAPTSTTYELNTREEFCETREVDGIWTPRTYEKRNISQSDISLLRLSEPVEYSDAVQPVCYLTHRRVAPPAVRSIGLVAGFGRSENDNFPLSESLQWSRFPTLSNEECSSILSSPLGLHKFCTGNNNDTGEAVCQGDIGGGIVYKENPHYRSRFVLKGIVSAIPKDVKGSCTGPYVYTHVGAFSDWILDTIESFEAIY